MKISQLPTRNELAVVAMQGIMAGRPCKLEPTDVAIYAVEVADALLALLKINQPEPKTVSYQYKGRTDHDNFMTYGKFYKGVHVGQLFTFVDDAGNTREWSWPADFFDVPDNS